MYYPGERFGTAFLKTLQVHNYISCVHLLLCYFPGFLVPAKRLRQHSSELAHKDLWVIAVEVHVNILAAILNVKRNPVEKDKETF